VIDAFVQHSVYRSVAHNFSRHVNGLTCIMSACHTTDPFSCNKQ